MEKNFWKKLKTPILALAPMAGFTDSAFRRICKDYGADVVYSEMASSSALFYQPKKTLELIKFTKKEQPYVVQLFGNDPEHFAFAAKLITKKIKPDGIDINFGCPAPKVFKTGAGCALMKNKKLAQEIITAVCKNTKLPVSIKIRTGLKNNSALDFIKNIKDFPFSAVMVHGRTYEEGFSGPVNFEMAEKIKKIIPNKIVLANGGIDTPEQALEILQKYPAVDGLGIARGALGKPYIFEEIKSALKCHPERIRQMAEKSKDLDQLDSSTTLGMTTIYDFKKIILKHAELVWKEKKSAGIIELKKHLGWYVRGFPGASELRQKLVRVKNLKEIRAILSCL